MGNVPDGASDVISELASLLSGDGMQGMFWTISIILCAMCFGGIVDCTGIMGQFANLLLKRLLKAERADWFLATEFSCIFVNAICCDQYLALVLPGRMFKKAFEDLRLEPKNLSRCLEDSGTITSNFFPWNTCGATMKNSWGVGSGYIPFAILNWLKSSRIYHLRLHGNHHDEGERKKKYARILEEREKTKAEALAA